MALVKVNIFRSNWFVVIRHDGIDVGLLWTDADMFYRVGKDFVKAAKAYLVDASYFYKNDSVIGGLSLRQRGTYIDVLKLGRLWFSAPYEYFNEIIKAVYTFARQIESDWPKEAMKQIRDIAIIMASSAPVFLTKDYRKIEEAFKLLKCHEWPGEVVVSSPKLIGGD